MNFRSLYDAEQYAQQIANDTGLPSAMFKPFNSDSYEVVLGRSEVDAAYAYENFCGSFVPA